MITCRATTSVVPWKRSRSRTGWRPRSNQTLFGETGNRVTNDDVIQQGVLEILCQFSNVQHNGELIMTDKLKNYSAAHREMLPSVTHSTKQYENNRAEPSHEPTRQRERQMRRFKSMGQAQRFLTVHGSVGNLFRLGRHLIRATHYREFRAKVLSEWQQVTCAC